MITVPVSPDRPDPDVIARAVDALRRGRVVAYPTDTLYGLAVDPRQDDAVDRLYAAKRRDAGMAIPLIAASIAQVNEAAALTPAERRLAEAFWPGPLTIVLRARDTISRKLAGPGATVAVRVPAHDVARALANGLGFCITATSANRSGQPPAVTAHDVRAALIEGIDLLLDAGPTSGGAPSTIVEMAADGPRLVRAGAIAWDRVLESLK
jgi:L-threonylcarbamoyladenylate synthase